MIKHQTIKHLFRSAVQNVMAHIRDYSVHPGKDFSRSRKFPADKLIHFLVAEGSSSTRVELLEFFDFDPDAPTSSAFRQQRAKLSQKPLRKSLRVSILPSLAWSGLHVALPRATAALPLMAPPPLSTAHPGFLPIATSYLKAIP